MTPIADAFWDSYKTQSLEISIRCSAIERLVRLNARALDRRRKKRIARRRRSRRTS